MLETLATPPDSILPNRTFGAFTYSGLSYVLAPNTEYWIVLSSSNSSLGWVGTSSASGIGVNGQYYYDGGGGPPVGTVLNGSGLFPFVFQMEINTAPAPVPEPSSLFLCGSLLVGVAVFAHRRVAGLQ